MILPWARQVTLGSVLVAIEMFEMVKFLSAIRRRGRTVVMSQRIILPLLRHSRLLQTYPRPILRQLPIQRTLPARRLFHVYPPIRDLADSSSSNPSTESTPPTESSESSSTANESSETPETKTPIEDSSPKKPDIPPPPPKRDVDPKDHELAELKVNQHQNQYLTLQDKYLRSIAEFRNLQAQTRREVAAAQAYTIQRFSVDLLDTVDTLNAAIESCPPLPPLESSDPNQREDVLVTEHRNLHEGLEMIEKILQRTLERHGLTPISTEGESLPGFHEVVKEIEGDEKDIGKIASVVKRGYMLNGKVLRPAKVCLSTFNH